MLLEPSDITGVILTGGKGERVNGEDKGCLKFKQTLLIERQIQWLNPQVKTILISANRNINFYQSFGYPVLLDGNNQFNGPLQGLLSAIKYCETNWLFLQPVDLPYLPHNLIQMFLIALSHQVENKIPHCFYLSSDQREHYLSLLIHRQYYSQLQQFLENGCRRVSDFHQLIGSTSIDLNLSEKEFKNLNFVKDYQ